MMTFVNMYSPGLKILATHRVLRNLDDFQAAALLAKARTSGWSVREGMPERGPQTFGSDRAGRREPRLRAGARSREMANWTCLCCTPKSWADCWGSAKKPCATRRYITYVRGIDAAVAEVREKGAQAAFLLEPTPIEDMARIAFAGGVMPQKSTDFYPKLLSGVTIYRL